jgi:glucose-6-phosphate dehydrogenase assembly protein OpcA
MTDDPNYDIAAQAGGLKISDIESKLGEMWAGQAGGPSPTATRVCTLNLVIVSHDGLDADTIMNATSVAAQQHPLRVLLLRSQLGGGETKPEGRVSGYCRMIKAGEIEVCCEQIVLTASGAHSGELAASAASLLVPDLPVALWWTGQPHFAGREFTRLMAISDHLIVDSRCFTDTAAGLTHLIACARDHKQVAVNDINWLRFAPWREQMADLFDEPAYRPLLFAVARMDIDYAAGAGSNPCQAVLLAGWLASRLKWSVVRCTEDSRGAYHAAVETADGRSATVRIAAVKHEHASPGDLVVVRMESDGSGAELRLTGGEHLELEASAHTTDAPQYTKARHLESQSLGQLLAAQVDLLGVDTGYQESLFHSCELALRPSGARDVKAGI